MAEYLTLMVLLSPLAFSVAALSMFLQPGTRPWLVKKLSGWATLISFPVAAGAIWMLAEFGSRQSPMLGGYGLGLSLRIDPLSVVMFAMIVLLAYVIVRFSRHYLEGDERHGIFLGRLCATIAAVEVLVISGNLGLFVLAWIATSLSLHSLLVFYPERPRAVIAGFKKFLAARTGDVCLISACVLLYLRFDTGHLEAVFRGAQDALHHGTSGASIQSAAILFAVAALLKSAQFPTHGWLVEVMETPTPVSALLHAGILNAGPFLVARMANIIHGSVPASALLILFGGFTALFASTVLLTQPTIKVALGYSSAAHMGFMLMVCGFGVYSAAILHLVAHSFYKAHAFLSSGSVVDEGKAEYVSLPTRRAHPFRVALSILFAVLIYLGFTALWGTDPAAHPARLAIGVILVMGLSQIIVPALDSAGSLNGTVRAGLLAVGVATLFFVLETAAHAVLSPVLPHGGMTHPVTLVLAGFVVTMFGTVVLFQLFGSSIRSSPVFQRLAIHLRKGLYANALFDRLVGTFDRSFREACKQR